MYTGHTRIAVLEHILLQHISRDICTSVSTVLKICSHIVIGLIFA